MICDICKKDCLCTNFVDGKDICDDCYTEDAS